VYFFPTLESIMDVKMLMNCKEEIIEEKEIMAYFEEK
jgi:hypothetical protein